MAYYPGLASQSQIGPFVENLSDFNLYVIATGQLFLPAQFLLAKIPNHESDGKARASNLVYLQHEHRIR